MSEEKKRISQHMPKLTKDTIEDNRIELYEKLSGPAYKLFISILRYMRSLTKPGVHGKSTILRTNKLTIDPKFVFRYNVVIKANYKPPYYEANKRARKLCKELVNNNVLHKIEKDEYMLNPKYYYQSNKYGDCYKAWCKLTGEDFEEKFNADYFLRHENLNYWEPIEDPEIIRGIETEVFDRTTLPEDHPDYEPF